MWYLVHDHTSNKRALLRVGGIEALVGLLIGGDTADSHYLAGRTLVQIATDNTEGAVVVRRRLYSVLLPPFAIEYTLRHAIVRRRMADGTRALSVLATLASIALEPVRACLAYELTPVAEAAATAADNDDGAEAGGQEGDQQAGRRTGSPKALRSPARAGMTPQPKTAGQKPVFHGRQGQATPPPARLPPPAPSSPSSPPGGKQRFDLMDVMLGSASSPTMS